MLLPSSFSPGWIGPGLIWGCCFLSMIQEYLWDEIPNMQAEQDERWNFCLFFLCEMTASPLGALPVGAFVALYLRLILQGQGGQGFVHSSWVENVPAHGRGVETKWFFKCLPFYDSMIMTTLYYSVIWLFFFFFFFFLVNVTSSGHSVIYMSLTCNLPRDLSVCPLPTVNAIDGWNLNHMMLPIK